MLHSTLPAVDQGSQGGTLQGGTHPTKSTCLNRHAFVRPKYNPTIFAYHPRDRGFAPGKTLVQTRQYLHIRHNITISGPTSPIRPKNTRQISRRIGEAMTSCHATSKRMEFQQVSTRPIKNFSHPFPVRVRTYHCQSSVGNSSIKFVTARI